MTGAPAPRPGAILTVVSFLLAAWIAFSFGFTPLRTSHDEWWHLKTGAWLSRHGLPETDIFTYTAADIPWHNHEWLTQLGMWGLYRAGEISGFGGWRLVILVKSLTIVAAFVGLALWLGRRRPDAALYALTGALLAALARRTFYPRPPFVSYLLLAIVLAVLIGARGGRRGRAPWGLPPLFALWANLHGGWMAGLVVVGAFWADAAAHWALAAARQGPRAVRRRRGAALRRLTLLGLLCALATLVNPYHVHLYALAGRVMNDPYLLPRIGEMLPPDWHYVWILEGVILLLLFVGVRPVRPPAWIGAALAAAALHCLLRATANPWLQTALALPVIALALARRPRRPGWLAFLLLACFFGQQGIHHVRHLSLLAVVLLPPLAWGLACWARAWRGRAGARRPTELTRLTPALIALLALALLGGYWSFSHRERASYLERNLMLARGSEWEPQWIDARARETPVQSTLPAGVFLVEPYPRKAVDFLLRAGLPAPLWNGGNYAGYLIWRLAPETMRVFTDNRYDVYGGRFVKQEHSVLEGLTQAGMEAAPAGEAWLREAGFMPWNEVLDRWGVQTVFVPVESEVNARLEEAGWARVWEDFSFAIWVRPTAENQPIIERAKTLPRPNPWLAVAEGREGT
ncbi:MAG TPA: hypothetical protein PLS90_03910 [Candidatus Sumerlaeota bacterium]|nr:hypothetical protein [Candidatus Sumerlaeota bacterium]HOR27376.1 hypothetical protein [Candidatus Sumerlaeota bacterium]HPK01582.1 hypothetical protein [Candidatus Sumerlaeota bacterium]